MSWVILFLLLVLSRYTASILTELHIKHKIWPFNKKITKLEFKNKLSKEEERKLQQKYSKEFKSALIEWWLFLCIKIGIFHNDSLNRPYPRFKT